MTYLWYTNRQTLHIGQTRREKKASILSITDGIHLDTKWEGHKLETLAFIPRNLTLYALSTTHDK